MSSSTFIFKIPLVFIGFATVLILCYWLFNTPIAKFQVVGKTDFISEQEVEQLLQQWKNSSILLANIHGIKQKLLEHPWVKQVAIKRNWPDVLQVTIVEVLPIALWKPSIAIDCRVEYFRCQLLTEKGNYAIHRKSNPIDYTMSKIIARAENKEHIKNKYLYSVKYLQPLNLNVVSLQLSRDNEWELIVGNQIAVLVGSRDFENRIQRLAQVWDAKLQSVQNSLQRIDLRYSNGLAVRHL